MSTSYHGKRPVTQDDISMAKKHLVDTLTLKKKELKLNNSKISDHKQAKAETSNPASKAYNQDHIKGHVKDNKQIKKVIAERQASMKTVQKLKPDRTYDDERRAKVTMMNNRSS